MIAPTVPLDEDFFRRPVMIEVGMSGISEWDGNGVLLLIPMGEETGSNAAVRMGCMVRSEPGQALFSFCMRNC